MSFKNKMKVFYFSTGLLAGVISVGMAFAEPPSEWHRRDNMHRYRISSKEQQNSNYGRGMRRRSPNSNNESGYDGQGREHGRKYAQCNENGYCGNPQAAPTQAQDEQNRRGKRLSEDERRTLRRQINEAAETIYPSKSK